MQAREVGVATFESRDDGSTDDECPNSHDTETKNQSKNKFDLDRLESKKMWGCLMIEDGVEEGPRLIIDILRLRHGNKVQDIMDLLKEVRTTEAK